MDVDVAFHTPGLAQPRAALLDWLRAEPAILPEPAALAIAVLSPGTGADLRDCGDLADAVAGGQLVAPVRWDAVSRALAERGASWILDFGPGTDVAALTAENLRGHGARTLALASPEGRRRLTLARRLAGRPGRRATRASPPASSSCPAAAAISTAATRATPAARP